MFTDQTGSAYAKSALNGTFSLPAVILLSHKYNQQLVEWIGADYTMDPHHPLQPQWKLKFIHSKDAALKFMILYNYHIALHNKYLNKNEFLEAQVCYICYDFIHESKLLFCGHIGCNSCITQWIESSKQGIDSAQTLLMLNHGLHHHQSYGKCERI
eukprot:1065705_1